MLSRRLAPLSLCSAALALAAGCATPETGSGGTGGAGAASAGSGGAVNPGSGGASNPGSGGASNPGSGGASNPGSGGASNPGSGGASNPGSGGGPNPGSGGRANTGGTGPGGSAGTGSGTGGRANSGGAGAGGAATGTGGTGTGGAGTAGAEFWISPTGKDTNPGTKDAPMFTLCDDDLKAGACYKLCPMATGCIVGGGTIWVMDGTYKYGSVVQKIGSSKLGTANGVYKVFAVAGAKPVFDFTGQAINKDNRGIQLQGDYWHIKGITVTKAGDTGIFVMGNNNIIEQCVTHHNEDAGLVIGVNSNRSGTGQNNLILNCDSYQNFDSETDGENADGFGLKENTGAGNVFRGCRAWDNGDDGWDFYGWSSPITLENCWAINQTATIHGAESDGNGFKLGGDGVSAAHKLTNCYATGNGTNGTSGRGFTNNSNPAALSCSGTCASWGNKAADQGVSGVGTTAPAGATAAKMIAAQRDANGNLPPITGL